MSRQRWRLERALSRYITDTETYMATAKYFYDRFSKWKDLREEEHMKIMIIKEKTLKIDPSFTMSEGKHKKFSKCMKSKFQFHKDSRLEKRENELAEVLQGTLRGLEELDRFLDAIEKLAVTSLHVFTENQILRLPGYFDHVQDMIKTAQKICPLLLTFKRDAKTFFLPKIQNVEILANCLRTYIDTTNNICVKHGYSFNFEMCFQVTDDYIVLDADYLYIQQMINHIEELDKIRMDEHFRMEFLFQKVSSEGFIDMFPDTWRTMQHFLNELEQCAAQLEKMKEGENIANVVGGAVAVAGHGFAIGGMALAPTTLGASFLLTFIGKMMAVASGANALVTNLTKVGVNHTHQKKAHIAFQRFLEDFRKIEYYLDGIPHPTVNLKPKKMAVVKAVGAGFVNAGGVAIGVNALIRATSFRKSKASPQGAVKEDVGFSKGFGSFLFELIFVGMGISSVASDSMDLAKGSKTKVSKFLRARIALLRSQIDSWVKIYNSLLESQRTQEENRNILEKPFYREKKRPIYPATYYLTQAPLQGCLGDSYLYPPVTGYEVGYTLGSSPSYHRAPPRNTGQTFMHPYSYA